MDETAHLRELIQKALKKLEEINDYCELIVTAHDSTENEKTFARMVQQYCLEAHP